jgi:AraC-like DNA-binding protein
MGVIFAIGAVQALFFSILLISKKNKRSSDKYLIGIFLIMMLFLWFAFSNTFKFYLIYPQILILIVLVPLLYGPMLYFYVNELIAKNKNNINNFLPHILPIIVYYILMLPMIFDGKDGMLLFFTERFIDLPIHVNLGVSIQYLSAPTYFILILFNLRKHQGRLKDWFSNLDNVDLHWLRYFVIGAMLFWTLEIIMIVLTNYTSYPTPLTFSYIIKSLYVVFIFFLGFYGLKQGIIITNINIDNKEENTFFEQKELRKEISNSKRKTYFPDYDTDKLKDDLIQHLENEKPYLNCDLKQIDLALQVKIPSHILSFIINEKLKKNYFDFINEYRVNESKKKLIDPKNSQFTILSIAYDCGFNSKSSFNRIFKNHTGITPSEYQREKLQ